MKNPTYITKNRLGIYYFQYSYTYQNNEDSNEIKRALFRKSLRTRDKKEATLRAKFAWIFMTKIQKKYFKNAELLGIGMKLLAQWDFVTSQDWGSADDFLAELDDDEIELLELAEKQREQDFLESKHYQRLKVDEKKTEDKKSPFLSELIKKWLLQKERVVKESTMASYRNQISLFEAVIKEIYGKDIRILNIDSELIREFNIILTQLPANRNAEIYQGKSYKELALLKVEKISSKTYHYYINVVIDFLTWSEAQGYIENTKLKTILQSSKKSVAKRGKFNKVDFDPRDLKKIFLSKPYMTGSFKRATDYWLPLIALFTGARLGEICQLRVADIKKEDNIYCIDINEDDEGKSVKTKDSSVRLIPIHQVLLDLGLNEYVEELKRNKKTNLFDINYGIIRGQYHSVQKHMSAYLKKIGIVSTDKKSKSFHSFRHTVRTRLTELDVPERTIDAIVGHASEARSIGSKIYTHSKLLNQKVTAMKKLEYDIDFSKIKKWQDCKFASL